MVEMLQAGETSPKISLGVLTLAIDLEEPEIYKEIRKIVPLKTITGAFLPLLKALDLNLRVRLCQLSTERVSFS